MSNAYRLLFKVENHLRRFVESKLREKYGSDWWEKGASQGLRNKVDSMHKDELALGWKVSTATSLTEYLQFFHIESIIARKWKEVFESEFKDLSKIQLRLKELENIRNVIAHTLTLSVDAMTRLEQYSSDILAMT